MVCLFLIGLLLCFWDCLRVILILAGITIAVKSEQRERKKKIMAKDYAGTAKAVLKQAGGEENVSHLEHCSMRLRFSIADAGKVDKDALKAIPGVMGVVSSGNQCQVVIGNDVIEVYDELLKRGLLYIVKRRRFNYCLLFK